MATKKKTTSKPKPASAEPKPKAQSLLVSLSGKKLSLIAQTVLNAKESNARKGSELLARIQTRIAWIEESFYDIGKSLQGLRAPAVWGALNYASFEALVQSVPNLNEQMAYRFMRIVDHYEESTAIALTQTKALALLTYVEATPEADDAESLARVDAEVGGIPISKQTVRGILEAASEARPSVKKRKRPGEDEAKARGKQLERSLEALTQEAVSVRVVQRKGVFRAVVDVPVALFDAIAVKNVPVSLLGKKKK